MDRSDRMVLNTVLRWHRRSQAAVLLTVVETYGAAPRPAGSLYAVNTSGDRCGTLSGGCLESWLHTRLATVWPQAPGLVIIGADARLGLPCGGTLTLLIEPAPSPRHIRIWLRAARHGVIRSVPLDGEAPSLRHGGASVVVTGRDVIDIAYPPAPRLLITGATEVSAGIVHLARGLGFDTTVCEPREAMRAHWRAGPLTTAMPDDVVAAHADAHTAVLALAHDPRLDDLALWAAVDTDAFYIGVLGSARSYAHRMQRLTTLGVTGRACARIHGPVGLAIGARTPAEIAIAIVAAVIAAHHTQAAPAPALTAVLGA
ncbi:MAG: XdhC family protein [Acidiferrobacter sp.]